MLVNQATTLRRHLESYHKVSPCHMGISMIEFANVKCNRNNTTNGVTITASTRNSQEMSKSASNSFKASQTNRKPLTLT